MRTAVERILETWEYVFERQGAHPPLLVSLQGLTAAQAAWKPSPDRNSVWEIINHIALWKEYFASRLAGELLRWPNDPMRIWNGHFLAANIRSAYHYGQISYIRALQHVPTNTA